MIWLVIWRVRRYESIEFLKRYGVIRENTDFVELEDVYLKFFEEVLEVNEEIKCCQCKGKYREPE